MRKVKHYWGYNRKGRRLRRSMPRWMKLVVTFTETYNSPISEFLKRWGGPILNPEPEEPVVIRAVDKDTGVEGLYSVTGLYPISCQVMGAIEEQVKDGTTIINFDGGFVFEPKPEIKKIVEKWLVPTAPEGTDQWLVGNHMLSSKTMLEGGDLNSPEFQQLFSNKQIRSRVVMPDEKEEE